MPLFTVDHANRTLPLVRRIVEDVVREHARREERLARLGRLEQAGVAGGASDGLASLEREIRAIGRDLEAFQDELAALGILLKDPRTGLVDFPSELDGRRVLLCWRLGEPAVQFWHDESAGFAGRQPLAPTFVG